MPQQIVVISDLHVGSTAGLWPSDYISSEGVPIGQNKFQTYLWTWWLDLCKKIKELDNPIIVLNGDIIQGVNMRDGQLTAASHNDQQRAAKSCLDRLPKKRK